MEYLVTMESDRYGHEEFWYDTRMEQFAGAGRLVAKAEHVAETDKQQRRVTIVVLPVDRDDDGRS